MKKFQPKNYRCVIGKIMSFPNELSYLQAISSRKRGVWIGYCKGDSSHKEHIFVLKKSKRWILLKNSSDIFKKPDGTVLGSRMFDRVFQLRCPVGKVYMNIQKKLTRQFGMPNVDIYRCKGKSKGTGHKEHLVKIHHGSLEVEINKKRVGVLIVTVESK